MDVTKVCNSVKELDKDTQLALSYLIEAMNNEGLEYKIFETYRSQERQNYLFEQGRTRSGSIVTKTKTSIHTKRRAVDIIHSSLLWNAPNSFWKSVADLAVKVGFSAGYYWKGFQDKPHIQLPIGVVPKKIVKEEDEYMVKNIEMAINGKVITVPAVEIEGRTYPQLAALGKTGDLVISFNAMPLLDFVKKEELICINGEDVPIECIKIADRLYPRLADLNKSKAIKVGYKDNKPVLDIRKG